MTWENLNQKIYSKNIDSFEHLFKTIKYSLKKIFIYSKSRMFIKNICIFFKRGCIAEGYLVVAILLLWHQSNGKNRVQKRCNKVPVWQRGWGSKANWAMLKYTCSKRSSPNYGLLILNKFPTLPSFLCLSLGRDRCNAISYNRFLIFIGQLWKTARNGKQMMKMKHDFIVFMRLRYFLDLQENQNVYKGKGGQVLCC